MTADELLEAVRGLISDPSAWSQYAIARKADGTPCGPLSPDAVKRDIYGFMEKVSRDNALDRSVFHAVDVVLRKRMSEFGWGTSRDLDKVNDGSTHAELMLFLYGDGGGTDPGGE